MSICNMDKSINQVFNVSNKLKAYNITIGEIELIKETIQSIEVSYKNYTPVVLAKIVINDLYDLNLQHDWKDLTVNIYYMDIYDEFVDKNFTILNIHEKYDDKKNKSFVIEMQDTFSYTLEHSFLSKSYNSEPVAALEEYIEYLEINELIEEFDFSNIEETYYFSIPKNISNLDWFIFELNKFGYSFYQGKNIISIKSLEDLIPSSLIINEDNLPFTNETDNPLYKNKIYEMQAQFLKRKNIIPLTKSLAYNFNTKVMDFTSENDNSIYDLADGDFNLQDSISNNELNGYKYFIQQHLNFDEHDKKLKESYINAVNIEIITNGYIKNDINQLYELELRGNISTSDSQSKGNTILNGNYIGSIIIDKIIGDNMIQKIYLKRSDLTKRE